MEEEKISRGQGKLDKCTKKAVVVIQQRRRIWLDNGADVETLSEKVGKEHGLKGMKDTKGFFLYFCEK